MTMADGYWHPVVSELLEAIVFSERRAEIGFADDVIKAARVLMLNDIEDRKRIVLELCCVIAEMRSAGFERAVRQLTDVVKAQAAPLHLELLPEAGTSLVPKAPQGATLPAPPKTGVGP